MSLQANYTNFKESSTRLYAWAVALVAILLALTTPFILLMAGGRESVSLPLSFWIILMLTLFMTLLAGVLGFLHVSHHNDDISISPDRKGAGRGL